MAQFTEQQRHSVRSPNVIDTFPDIPLTETYSDGKRVAHASQNAAGFAIDIWAFLGSRDMSALKLAFDFAV